MQYIIKLVFCKTHFHDTVFCKEFLYESRHRLIDSFIDVCWQHATRRGGQLQHNAARRHHVVAPTQTSASISGI